MMRLLRSSLATLILFCIFITDKKNKIMSNEFDYKKYLKNNPLLEGEVEEGKIDRSKFKMVKISDEFVKPLVSAILDLAKSEDRFQDIVSFAKWMFQPEMRTTTIPEKAADEDPDFETDLTRILNNSDRLYTIMQLAWKEYKNSSEIKEVKENTFDPEVARGINSDVRKALDDFYESGDGAELAQDIEGIMFGNYNEEIAEETVAEEEISEMSEKEASKISDEIEKLADDEELGNLDQVVSAYLKKHPNHKGMEAKIRQIASRFVD